LHVHVIVGLYASPDPLIVIVDGHRKHLLGAILAHHVLVKGRVELSGRGHVDGFIVGLAPLIGHQDLLAESNAVIADVHPIGASDQVLHGVLGPSTERTARRLGLLAHFLSSSSPLGVGVSTLSITPYSRAASASIKKSRSVSCSMRSKGCPVCRARISLSFRLSRRISFA